MVADPLTKIKGPTSALFEMLESGSFCIVAEDLHLAQRKENRSQGMSNSDEERRHAGQRKAWEL